MAHRVPVARIVVAPRVISSQLLRGQKKILLATGALPLVRWSAVDILVGIHPAEGLPDVGLTTKKVDGRSSLTVDLAVHGNIVGCLPKVFRHHVIQVIARRIHERDCRLLLMLFLIDTFQN